MISREAKLPFEVVMLIIAAVVLLVTGVMLFLIYNGILPYYENGLYGLLLIIFALNTITLGRTPFGDIPRSKLLLVLGLLVAVIGYGNLSYSYFDSLSPCAVVFLSWSGRLASLFGDVVG